MGEFDLHPWEFYEYTFEEYYLKRMGAAKVRRKRLREEFQHARIVAYFSIAPYLSKKDKHKKLDDIIPDIYDQSKPAKPEKLKDHYKNILKRYKEAGLLN